MGSRSNRYLTKGHKKTLEDDEKALSYCCDQASQVSKLNKLDTLNMGKLLY